VFDATGHELWEVMCPYHRPLVLCRLSHFLVIHEGSIQLAMAK